MLYVKLIAGTNSQMHPSEQKCIKMYQMTLFLPACKVLRHRQTGTDDV